MVKAFFFCCTYFITTCASAQSNVSIGDTSATKDLLITVNQALDQAVVDKRPTVLQKHYAPDFYFLHGTGKIDSKASWMAFVLDTATRYASRTHDSVQVELHGDVALLTGILTVKRPVGASGAGYALRYIRLYANRKNLWQLLSHHTTQEWKLAE